MFVLQLVKEKFQQEYDIAPSIAFDGDRIALDIPDDGVVTDNGWNIVPLSRAQVSSRTYSYIHLLTCNVKTHLIHVVRSHQVEVLITVTTWFLIQSL